MSISRKVFLGKCDPHASLTWEGTPTCPTHKRALPKNKKLRASPAKPLAALHSRELRERMRLGQDAGATPPNTHCWVALSRAASAWARRCCRRLPRAGCLDGSWKCRLLCSLSRSSNLCFIVSAGNPKQREGNKEPGNSKQSRIPPLHSQHSPGRHNIKLGSRPAALSPSWLLLRIFCLSTDSTALLPVSFLSEGIVHIFISWL